ncbi:hypothetical protein LA6_004068 [Marinibacterium anthonyi]|nr:hypothetical protein LA6_004068 [Marinibacterium anthonyi]
MTDMVLEGDLDVAGAKDAAQAISDWLAGLEDDEAATLEVSEAAPTQVALQLLFAAARAVEGRDEVSFGPNATDLISKTSA